MTTEEPQETFGDRIREQWGRMAFGAVVAGLAFGFVLNRIGQARAATLVLAATCGVLITLPVINVIMVMVEEIRRRDWAFVALAVGVLGLIGYTIATRL
jgi:hypothetical protein